MIALNINGFQIIYGYLIAGTRMNRSRDNLSSNSLFCRKRFANLRNTDSINIFSIVRDWTCKARFDCRIFLTLTTMNFIPVQVTKLRWKFQWNGIISFNTEAWYVITHKLSIDRLAYIRAVSPYSLKCAIVLLVKCLDI